MRAIAAEFARCEKVERGEETAMVEIAAGTKKQQEARTALSFGRGDRTLRVRRRALCLWRGNEVRLPSNFSRVGSSGSRHSRFSAPRGTCSSSVSVIVQKHRIVNFDTTQSGWPEYSQQNKGALLCTECKICIRSHIEPSILWLIQNCFSLTYKCRFARRLTASQLRSYHFEIHVHAR